jgi:HlyD family secretion protein
MRFLLGHARVIVTVLVVLAIVAVALWPDTTDVDAAEVVRGPMQVTIDEDGETRVRDRFVVSAPVTGRLQRIELEPGDPVVAGTTVVARLSPLPSPLIDPRTRGELTAAVEAARAAVGAATAERRRSAEALARARSTLSRQRALAEAGAIAADDLEAADTAVRTAEEALRAAEFTVTRAEYELDLARARLQVPDGAAAGTVDVVAPISGVVLKRLRESESIVPSGDPLLEIGNPRDIEIVADFLSTDAVRIPQGAPVIVEQWGGGHPLAGRVRRVEPAGFPKVSALGVEEQRVYVVIDLVDTADASGANDVPAAGPGTTPDAGGWAARSGATDDGARAVAALGDGYRVEVRVVVWQEDDVRQVPIGSLFRRGDGWAVFVVDAGAARLQPVTLGRRNENVGQILEGLSEGQQVVMHPPDTLTDGMRVTARP